jgi:ferredoxin
MPKVTLKTPSGDHTFECDYDTYIQDAAEEHKIEPPYSCRAGGCSTCAARLISGKVDQSDQTFLDYAQIENGYILLCVSYPVTDCVISTDQEEELY